MARTLLDLRWSRSPFGDWVVGDPTGWRRTHNLGSALIYAAHWLRVPDADRHVAESVLLELTREDRHAAWRKGEPEPGLGWWSDQQGGATAVTRLIGLAILRMERVRAKHVLLNGEWVLPDPDEVREQAEGGPS